MNEINDVTEFSSNIPETTPPPGNSDSIWITLKDARVLTGRGKTTIRNWLFSHELPFRQQNGVCEVPKDKLMALHESKPRLSEESKTSPQKKNRAKVSNDQQAGSNAHGTMPTGSLRAHPLSAEIYGIQHDTRLLESVQIMGILSPLLVTAEGVVVSGGERLWAANESGMAEVPVRILPTSDETEIKLKVLEANIARDKTNEQRIREYNVYKEIETAKAHTRQGTRTDLGQNFTLGEKGKARDIAAAKVGWSGPNAEKGSQVLDAIDECSNTDNTQAVKEVRDALNNKSVDAAYKQVVALGWLGDSSPANRNKEDGKSGKAVVQKAYNRAKTAASKLANIVKAEEIALFTQVQIQELREMLEPLLKWIDGLEPRGPTVACETPEPL
jgi:hypothetical protein